MSEVVVPELVSEVEVGPELVAVDVPPDDWSDWPLEPLPLLEAVPDPEVDAEVDAEVGVEPLVPVP